MPNRIIKESICTSEEIDALSLFEEVFFYRLMVNCDDYGCMDARPRILCARLFPLKKISEETAVSALNKLNVLNLIDLYEVHNRPYLHMVSWEDHQQIRAHKHKYPFVDDENARVITADCIGYQMISDDINAKQSWDDIIGNQMISDDIKCVPNPIQSNPNPNPNPNPKVAVSDSMEELFEIEEEARTKERKKTKKDEPIDETPVRFQLLLNDKTMFDVHQSLIDEFADLYPAVDIEQEIRKMIGWINSKPENRKTRRGIRKFMNSWLAKAQDRGGTKKRALVGANGVKLSDTEDHSLDDIF